MNEKLWYGVQETLQVEIAFDVIVIGCSIVTKKINAITQEHRSCS
jgi:hypothetical protein